MERNNKKSSIKKARIGRELSRDAILHLIRRYRENECLWNYKKHQYNRFDLRNEAWEKIARELRMSADDVKRKMKSLRSTYLAEKKKLETFRGSNPADNSTNKEKLDVDLIHSESKTSTTSSLMIIDDNEQEQQYYQEETPTQSHTPYKQQENIKNQETYQLDHDVHQNSFSTTSFPSLSSNFHQMQRNQMQQQKYHENIKHPHLSTLLATSENKTMSQESTPIRSTVQSAPCSSKSTNLRYKSNSGNHGDRLNSKEILSAAYDLIQKDTSYRRTNKDSENNLKSFGEFIDEEFQKLDENSLVVAKMKINKILHEAALGMYKIDIKTDKNSNECNISIREDVNDVEIDDNETGRKSNSRRSTENPLGNNKENRIPTTLQNQDQNSRTDNNLGPQQASVFRKKRIKSKQILSAVYDVLSKEINNVESQNVSFGAYVCSELKTMNDETVKNAKLNICRVLYEASIGKYCNLTRQLLDEQIENQTQTDTETELVIPKIEVVDTSYEM